MGDGGTGVAPYKFDAQLGRKLRARFGTPERRIARPAPTPGANRGRARMPTGTAMRPDPKLVGRVPRMRLPEQAFETAVVSVTARGRRLVR
jgi:hypothetical protein